MSNSAAPRTFASLESLRGIAALAVVFHHVAWTNVVGDLQFFRNAYLMVDFFFVLSGFVIFHAYSERLASLTTVARFIWLRLGRLYPLHFFMLLVFLGIEITKLFAETFMNISSVSNSNPAFTDNNIQSFIANLLVIHAWGVCEYHTWNIAAWSISVEFFLYIVFAALFLVFSAKKKVLGLVGMPLIALLGMVLLSQQPHEPAQSLDILRGVCGFFTGAWMCALKRALPPLQKTATSFWSIANVAALLAAAAAVACLSFAGWSAVPLIYAVFAVLVLSCSCLSERTGINRFLTLSPLLWLGQVSYSIYMVNQAVYWGVRQFLRVVLKAPLVETAEGMQFVLPFWLSNLLLVTVVAVVLVCSGWTYRHVEDRYRRKSRVLADRFASGEIRFRPGRRRAA